MCFSTTSRSFRPWQKTRCPQLWQKESCMTPALANGFRSLLASRNTTKPITSTGTILTFFPNSLDVADFLQNRVKPSYRKHLISGMPLPAAKTSTKHTKKPATAAEPRQLTASKHPQAIYSQFYLLIIQLWRICTFRWLHEISCVGCCFDRRTEDLAFAYQKQIWACRI